MEVALNDGSAPEQLLWCGEDAVVIASAQKIQVIGPKGNVYILNCHGIVAMATEIDSLRIQFKGRSSLLMRRSTQLISAESSILAKFYDDLQQEDITGLSSLWSIPKDELCELTLQCIEAAVSEYDTSQQLRLLRVADLGRGYMPGLLCQDFVDAIAIIRILNNLRSPEVGIMMTYNQYKALSPAKVVMRLARRHQFSLALAFSSELSIRPDDILNYWAVQKVKVMHLSLASDDEIVHALTTNMMEYSKSTSFIKAVKYIYTVLQRKHLALQLLPLIRDEQEQINLLTQMKQLRMALQSSIKSQDIDMLTGVVVLIQQENPEFLRSLKTAADYNEIEQVMILLCTNLPMHVRRAHFLDVCNCFSPGISGMASLEMLNIVTQPL